MIQPKRGCLTSCFHTLSPELPGTVRIPQGWKLPVMLSSLSLRYRALTDQAEHQLTERMLPTHLNAQIFIVKISFRGKKSHKAAPPQLLLISTNTYFRQSEEEDGSTVKVFTTYLPFHCHPNTHSCKFCVRGIPLCKDLH